MDEQNFMAEIEPTLQQISKWFRKNSFWPAQEQ